MHRFYVEKAGGGPVTISDAGQLHHLRDVLRLKAGDEVIVFDAAGNESAGVIDRLDRKQAAIRLTEARPRPQTGLRLAIACAIPRGSRMDDLIDHLTQLGCERVIPVVTERVVARPDGAGKAAKLERWRKIALSAARQCRRCGVPDIGPVTDLAGVIAQAGGYDLKLIPHLSGERRHIRDVLAGGKPESVIVLIGPEGDFTPEEVALALGAGFVPVSLGADVLRVATAAAAVAAYLRFALGD